MKKRKRLQLIFLLMIPLCLIGCADKSYVAVNPAVFNYETALASGSDEVLLNDSDWQRSSYLLNLFHFVRNEMNEHWDTESVVLPYGPFLIEYRRIADKGLTVSNVTAYLP